MGQRVNYEIIAHDGTAPVAILASNSHHEAEDPVDVFRRAVRLHRSSQSDLVADLLSHRYTTASGQHRPGDRMFAIDLYPADRELVLQAVYGPDGMQVREVPVGPGTEPPTPDEDGWIEGVIELDLKDAIFDLDRFLDIISERIGYPLLMQQDYTPVGVHNGKLLLKVRGDASASLDEA